MRVCTRGASRKTTRDGSAIAAGRSTERRKSRSSSSRPSSSGSSGGDIMVCLKSSVCCLLTSATVPAHVSYITKSRLLVWLYSQVVYSMTPSLAVAGRIASPVCFVEGFVVCEPANPRTPRSACTFGVDGGARRGREPANTASSPARRLRPVRAARVRIGGQRPGSAVAGILTGRWQCQR